MRQGFAQRGQKPPQAVRDWALDTALRHWFGAGPVRIILMPCHDTTMHRRFAEQLIVPEPDRPSEQLRRGRCEGGVPENIMKCRQDSPRSKGMKQHATRIRRFVRIVFVPEFRTGMTRLRECRQFNSQLFDLSISQDFWPCNVAVFVEKCDLFRRQFPLLPFLFRSQRHKQIVNRLMKLRQILTIHSASRTIWYSENSIAAL